MTPMHLPPSVLLKLHFLFDIYRLQVMMKHTGRQSTDFQGVIDDEETSSSSHDDSVDLEKALLPASQDIVQRSKRDINQNRLPLLPRPMTWLTLFNIGIFVASCIAWSKTLSKQTLKDQDLWKATSFYCKLFLTVSF